MGNYNGGVCLVSHDARLIKSIGGKGADLWVVEDGQCYRFEKDFEGYVEKVMDALKERQDEVERQEKKRREERERKRKQFVKEAALEKARKEKEKADALKAQEDEARAK